MTSEMTSVLYGGGLNYQAGNPVRQEIVLVRREVESLRKQLETATEENLVYRKHLMKLLQATEAGATEFTADLMRVTSNEVQSRPPPGVGTVQGAGFTR
jgi:hypothetical protein